MDKGNEFFPVNYPLEEVQLLYLATTIHFIFKKLEVQLVKEIKDHISLYKKASGNNLVPYLRATIRLNLWTNF
jgi:hypothetical protein